MTLKKTSELTYGGAPKLNGKGEMTAYYTNRFGIVSGLQAHGAQLERLTFENINWASGNYNKQSVVTSSYTQDKPYL